MLTYANFGILVLRVELGIVFIAHGGQKLWGWFGGQGFRARVESTKAMGLRPPLLWALFSACGEFFGGLGILVGLLTPIAVVGIIGSMLVAIIQVHGAKGFWNTKGGYEYPLSLLTVAFVVGLTGAGRYSLDNALGLALPEPLTYLVFLALTVIAVAVAVVMARSSKSRK